MIGEFARTPRYQGAGSSQVNPTRLDAPLDALRAGRRRRRRSRPGFTIAGGPAGDDDGAAAPRPSRWRATPGPSSCSSACPVPTSPRATTARTWTCPPTRSRCCARSPRSTRASSWCWPTARRSASTDWRDLAPAILETWLGGQAGGSAVADLLLGVRNPSGRLTETIPHRLEDTPAYGNFPGEAGDVRYGEGVLVGYRWYDTRAMDVAYPFGHGLSYTTFAYSDVDRDRPTAPTSP